MKSVLLSVIQSSLFWQKISWVFTGVYLLLALLPLPSEAIEEYWSFELLGWDKAAHFCYCFGWGIALAASQIHRLSPPRSTFFSNIQTILIPTAMGIVGELLQVAVPWRFGLDIGDILANTTGATLAWLCFQLNKPFLHKIMGTKKPENTIN